jgi:hypothetical protein
MHKPEEKNLSWNPLHRRVAGAGVEWWSGGVIQLKQTVGAEDNCAGERSEAQKHSNE